jgi:FkbH-like protein
VADAIIEAQAQAQVQAQVQEILGVWVTEWGVSPGPTLRSPEPRSAVDVSTVAYASSLIWAEHCIECAIPECYSVCPLYVARQDHKCARFKYGIYANGDFPGLFEFGADLHFRRWGRLEAPLNLRVASPRRMRQWAQIDRASISLINPIARVLSRIDPKRRLNGVYRVASDQAFVRAASRIANQSPAFDEFLIEVLNPNPSPVSLIVEIRQDVPVYRASFSLLPGQSVHRIPFSDLVSHFEDGAGRILVYPENDAEVRLVFRWLDLVRYREKGQNTGPMPGESTSAEGRGDPRLNLTPGQAARVPAAKVKCVAWDLDNTLWAGVLVDDGPEVLALRPGVVEAIKGLDGRGILNTIVSKNDHDPAWAKVVEFGLSEFFVSPAINWGAKSANLRGIAETLNIGIDTFLLIDDSAFERAEVSNALPEVRVVDDQAIDQLLDRPEFDVPVTAEAKQRRLSYLAEDTRRAVAATSRGSYEEFLTSCEMITELFVPESPTERERVLELLLRSNQLNLSTRRYTPGELGSLLGDPSIVSLGIRCHDRFGDYGIVGFLAIATAGTEPRLRDLVISCRIAQKKVENAIFQWLMRELNQRHARWLEAAYLPTARNHVLLAALMDVGFGPREIEDGMQILRLDLSVAIPDANIVTIQASADAASSVHGRLS